MKRKHFLLTLFSLLLLMVVSKSAWALDKVNGIYQIGTAADLEEFAALVNDGNVYANAVLTADIDKGTDGTMIGRDGVDYQGFFDGQGHTIKINTFSGDTDGTAIFRNVGDNALIKNLKVQGTITSEKKYASGIAAWSSGTIQGCYIDVNVVSSIAGDATHGGVVGVAYQGAMIENCLAKFTINGATTQNSGGVVGWCDGRTNVINCLVINDGSNFDLSNGGSGTIGRNDGQLQTVNLESYLANIYDSRPGGASTNNYATNAWGNTKCVTIVAYDDLADGRICYQLNTDQSDIAWVQTIGKDPFPVPAAFGSGQVYASRLTDCDGKSMDAATFSNEGSVNATPHQFDKFGICERCGCFKINALERDMKDGYYLIKTPEDIDIAEGWNRITNGARFSIKLANDLTYTAEPGRYIFNASNWFDGNFNGDGHELTIEMTEMTGNNVSLFPKFAGRRFENVIMHGTFETNGQYAGSVAGQTYRDRVNIINVFSDIDINTTHPGDNTTGGLIGIVESKTQVLNTIYAGNINGNPETTECLAGFCGWSSAQTYYTNCAFIGTLNGAIGDSKTLSRNPSNITCTNVYFANEYGYEDEAKATLIEDAGDIESGALAYALNGNEGGVERFYQKIGEDMFPMPIKKEGGLVYKIRRIHCNGDVYKSAYFNEDITIMIDEHNFIDGICSYCGLSDKDNINFADASVKAICVANWDKNGNGELSYAEAASVISLGEMFQSNTSIKSFNELQYFIGLQSIGDSAFSGCSNLTSITIPNRVTSIDNSAFQDCSNLTIVTLESNAILSTGTSLALKFGRQIETYIIGDGITSIGNNSFASCSGLTEVMIGSGVKSIGNHAFYRCHNLKNVTSCIEEPFALDINYTVFDSYTYQAATLYVPVGTIESYQATDGWKNFKNIEEIKGYRISISLPEGTNVQDYAMMWLELTNTESGQKSHYVITDRKHYTFANIPANTSWNIVLRNERGDIFGQIDNVEVKNEDVSVTFTSLSKPQSVTLSVLTPEGQDVTSQTQVTWTDSAGNYLSQGASLSGLPVGYQTTYSVALSQELAMIYETPLAAEYTLKDGSNNITCQLDSIPQVQLSGKVKDAETGLPLSGAVISASQTFGGKYSKTLSAKTDSKGIFTLEVANVPTTIAIAASDYISQTLDIPEHESHELLELEDVLLKPITGATISLDFTYTTCEGETQEWYSDYNNVSYTLYNITKQQGISQFNVQYPQIVLLEEVEDGDELKLTASSRTTNYTNSTNVGAFMPVEVTVTIAGQKAEAAFAIVELGKVQARFAKTGNAAVVGTLYDVSGKLVKTDNYLNASLTINDLADGQYTLLSMGSSRLFNTIYDLAQLPQTGLVEGSDYVKNQVEVKSGVISQITIAEVPTLDESKLYYTGDNTSFTVNKPSIVAGNYLTLTGRIDFKSEYASNVSNVQMIVDLPESCEFIENSVMVGTSTNSYMIDGNRITIPMANYNDRLRLCVIPTAGGNYAPSAFVQFDLSGETITQPIGSANYTVKDLSISVPPTVAKTLVSISGTAIGTSNVELYDNDVQIGQTTSLANGNWSATCELNEPYNLSTHSIYAKVTTKAGLELQSETVECLYDMNAIEVKTVTMINTAHPATSLNTCEFVTVFDFQDNTTSATSYNYWPSYPDFTFLVDFTKNDTTIVKNVYVNVFTDHNDIKQLKAAYNDKIDKWVAVSKFHSDNLPVNVSMDYEFVSGDTIDNSYAISLQNENFDLCISKMCEDIEANLGYEVVSDGENEASVNLMHSGNETPYTFTIKTIDYSKIDSLLNLYTFIRTEEDTLKYSIFEEMDDYCYHAITIDENEKFIYETMITDYNSGNYNEPAKARSLITWEFILKELKETNYGNLGSGLLNTFGINRYIKVPADVWAWINLLETYIDSEYRWSEAARNVINKKCNDGSWRLDVNDINMLLNECRSIDEDASLFHEQFYNFIMLYKWQAYYSLIYESLLMCIGNGIGKGVGGLSKLRTFWSNPSNKFFFRFGENYYFQKIWRNRLKSAFDFLGNAAFYELMQKIEHPELYYFDENADKRFNVWAPKTDEQIKQRYAQVIIKAKKLYKTCEEPPLPPNPPLPPCPPVPPILDPSGFVYEGVPSNRLQGVTVTAYYKEMVEDMYGDMQENIVKWDASEYAQENPLFTDEYGMYQWDVPQGLWQVKFEKAGYETTYSDWLPVPPPQLDINIAMKQARQPEVKNVHAYEDGVELTFDKYMLPELLNTDNIQVIAPSNSPEGGETAVEGTIELLNEEASYEGATETFVSKVRFNAAQPFTAKEVTLIVNNSVKSYADIPMQDNYEQTLTIEKEVKEIVVDSLVKIPYEGTGMITVQVLPADASAGKTLHVETSSPMILGVESEQVVIDNEGKAEITIIGELPGTAALTFSVVGTYKEALTIVNVAQMEPVATPTASIASGSIVKKGTQIELFCATEGATIFYTLDGSCPCVNSEVRKVYDGTPITIEKNTVIKAMASAPDMEESEVATFVYIVTNGDLNLDGKVDIADGVVVLNIMAASEYQEFADLNQDQKVDIADLVVILNIMAANDSFIHQ